MTANGLHWRYASAFSAWYCLSLEGADLLLRLCNEAILLLSSLHWCSGSAWESSFNFHQDICLVIELRLESIIFGLQSDAWTSTFNR